ncbi:hypothetical protein OAI16_07435 [Flavobacteriaceae bacterium]|nr:hypothetical protein [Flavobacteriaceae bacterium]
MKNIICIIIFSNFLISQTNEQIELELNDVSKSWIKALYSTPNPENGNNYKGEILNVNIFPDYTSVEASFTLIDNRFYWNTPSFAYINIRGAKFKLLEVYKRGGPWGIVTEAFEKLELYGGYFNKGQKNTSVIFAFIFEKIPNGSEKIDIVLSGKDVYDYSGPVKLGSIVRSDVYKRGNQWEDIFSNFKNVKVLNPFTNIIKKRVPKSNY